MMKRIYCYQSCNQFIHFALHQSWKGDVRGSSLMRKHSFSIVTATAANNTKEKNINSSPLENEANGTVKNHTMSQPEPSQSVPRGERVVPLQEYRLNRCLIGYSRRQADALIERGKVFIDKRRATLGSKVQAGEKVYLNGKQIEWESYFLHQFTSPSASALTVAKKIEEPVKEEAAESSEDQNLSKKKNKKLQLLKQQEPKTNPHVYLKLWKEKNVICTTGNQDGLRNLFQTYRFSKPFPNLRLFPVGRLDKDSTGLLLITSDPSFQTAILQSEKHPPPSTSDGKGVLDPGPPKKPLKQLSNRRKLQNERKIEKIYQVTFDRMVEPSVLDTWRKGFELKIPIVRRGKEEILTIQTKPCVINHLKASSVEGKGATYELILREGKNRQVRRMAEEFGYQTKGIHRVGFCGITLQGLPAPGTWKHLSLQEITSLKKLFVSKELYKQ